MENNNIPALAISEIEEKLTDYCDKCNYSESTRYFYFRVFDDLKSYMNGQEMYTPDIGKLFSQKEHSEKKAKWYYHILERLIYILNCFISGESIKKRMSPPPVPVPKGHEEIYNNYISICEEKDSQSSLRTKRILTRYFLEDLETCGCHTINEITPELVLKATLIHADITNYCSYSKYFLKYLARNGILSVDYSPLVPAEKQHKILPDVYSKEEILRLESSYDRSTSQGKRDYAMVLFATRLKLRPSDIAALQLSAFDYEKNVFSIVQQKTDEPLTLPILPEIKTAVQDYLTVRPNSHNPFMFLGMKAPFDRLAAASVYNIVKSGFKNAEIEAKGRGQGAKALRSSGSSHQVNNGMSYANVSASNGQKDPNVVRHYARLHVSELRKCALEPVPATEGSFFDKFLKGDVVL